ncbi:DDB1- and CUL4-associated factor 15 isoform X1 [Pygocentrus nattereri]|uniref:DDB1- and CUL4-associated factor 15 WD40 repeat-containing domain-containing protein n=1 Tax=Pygocentrus nattereri TaxID=42514 RepID=A0A3B4D7K0_PYGNA|nr:DDB1- and CUL4-associated factor 15 isoform X1 [Pygocentrus nattereri]
MAPSSKSEKDEQKQKQKQQRKQKEHVVKVLTRGKLYGQLSQRLFRKLPPRVCVPLKSIVSEEFLRAGHIFLGFTKCGRYVLSYTSDCGEDDDFSFYTYHLYWWEFNLHSRLKQVHHVRLFAGEDIYSELYLTVCEWHNDHSKIVIFGFNTRSSSSALMNMMMSDENNRDIYITIASMPPAKPCQQCCPVPTASTIRTGGECLEHGYVLNARYQVVYPFPTFQPALQLKKDQVILLNTSYSLVACAISLCSGGKQETDGQNNQILYRKREAHSSSSLHPPSPSSSSSSSSSHGSPDRRQTNPHPTPLSPSRSQAAVRAREFAADIFRRAQAAGTEGESERCRRENDGKEKAELKDQGSHRPSGEIERRTREKEDDKVSLPGPSTSGRTQSTSLSPEQEDANTIMSPASTSSASSLSPRASSSPSSSEPGYVNYTRLRYRLQQSASSEQENEEEDDKVQLPFTVSDLKGRNLQLVTGHYAGQCVCVEQLTLDFEYLINEVIRNDAEWASQFCSFSDYDVVILEVCPETNIVVINIGLLLLAFSNCEEEHSRPKSYHSSLQVSWDLNTGACCTVGVGDLIEVKGQTSGSVWSSYRKSCVNTVMRWLVPESSSRYINRMTNEALHKGTSLQVLADSDRGTWIVL